MRSPLAVAMLGAVVLTGAAVAFWSLQDAGPEPEAVDGEEIPLQYVPEGFPMGLSVTQSFALHLFGQPGPEFERATLPPETEAARTYDAFRIAGGEFLTVTEASDPPRVWFDTSADGDLADEPGPACGEKAGGVVPNFYTLQLPSRSGGEPFPYRLWIFPSNMGGTRFYAACHMTGELDAGGEPLKVVLFDTNSNGDYSDDPVGIDADGDGKLSDAEMIGKGCTREMNGVPVTLQAASADGRTVRLKH